MAEQAVVPVTAKNVAKNAKGKGKGAKKKVAGLGKRITKKKKASANAALSGAFDELYSRFIYTCPKEDLMHPNRFLFVCERAHWYYLDFLQPQDTSNLQVLSDDRFLSLLLSHKKLYGPPSCYKPIYKAWGQYKAKVTVCGCILLNEKLNKVLMVKSFGTHKPWCFPGGKINKDEALHDCAIREVHEELGIDVSSLLDIENMIHVSKGKRQVHQFVIPYIPEDLEFTPNTRCEIEETRWFSLDKLGKQIFGKDFLPKIREMIAKYKKQEKRTVEEEEEEEEEEAGNPLLGFKFKPSVYEHLLH